MAALVPGVDIEAERGHVGIISGQPRRRKEEKLSNDGFKLDRKLQN
jgi:hypothetical protein